MDADTHCNFPSFSLYAKFRKLIECAKCVCVSCVRRQQCRHCGCRWMTRQGGFGGVDNGDDHVVGPVRDSASALSFPFAIVFGCRLSQLAARSLKALAFGTSEHGLWRGGERGPAALDMKQFSP